VWEAEATVVAVVLGMWQAYLARKGCARMWMIRDWTARRKKEVN
jgi:hypothetical protein